MFGQERGGRQCPRGERCEVSGAGGAGAADSGRAGAGRGAGRRGAELGVPGLRGSRLSRGWAVPLPSGAAAAPGCARPVRPVPSSPGALLPAGLGSAAPCGSGAVGAGGGRCPRGGRSAAPRPGESRTCPVQPAGSGPCWGGGGRRRRIRRRSSSRRAPRGALTANVGGNGTRLSAGSALVAFAG